MAGFLADKNQGLYVLPTRLASAFPAALENLFLLQNPVIAWKPLNIKLWRSIISNKVVEFFLNPDISKYFIPYLVSFFIMSKLGVESSHKPAKNEKKRNMSVFFLKVSDTYDWQNLAVKKDYLEFFSDTFMLITFEIC